MEIKIILNGTEKSITLQELYALAAQGFIHPNTRIIVDGKPTVAGRAKGIVFGNAKEVFGNTSAPQREGGATPEKRPKVRRKFGKADAVLAILSFAQRIIKTVWKIILPIMSRLIFALLAWFKNLNRKQKTILVAGLIALVVMEVIGSHDESQAEKSGKNLMGVDPDWYRPSKWVTRRYQDDSRMMEYDGTPIPGTRAWFAPRSEMYPTREFRFDPMGYINPLNWWDKHRGFGWRFRKMPEEDVKKIYVIPDKQEKRPISLLDALSDDPERNGSY